MKERTWIFPPALGAVKVQFEALYNHLFKTPDRRKPLMIVGDRGVGKSAFVDLFEELYAARGVKGVKRLNIASLPETLLVSELFGHVKGAFTDAKGSMDGHLKTLGDGGLLILEEIGEISPQVQAKLLTVIEDGEFYPIGERKTPQRAKNIQIIATTNSPRGAFRPDFYDRFFAFKVPALHERRLDVLYYVGYYFPELIKNLTAQEVLALLCYHWPGNVREIEHVCDRIKWRQGLYLDARKDNSDMPMPDEELWMPASWLWDPKEIKFYAPAKGSQDGYGRLMRSLALVGLDLTPNDGDGIGFPASLKTWQPLEAKHIGLINRELAKYRLFFIDPKRSATDYLLTFVKLSKSLRLPKDLKSVIQSSGSIAAFDHVATGLRLFCALTGQDHRENRNLLIAPAERYEQAEDQGKRLSECDYYEGLLRETGGNKKKAAAVAGVKYTTFISRLKKFNIS